MKELWEWTTLHWLNITQASFFNTMLGTLIFLNHFSPPGGSLFSYLPNWLVVLRNCRTARKTFFIIINSTLFLFFFEWSDVHVDMWTYVNDCVCLDVVHVWVAETQLLAPPLGGADNTRGDCVLQGERATNGDHELARAQVCRASQQQHGQLHLHTQEGAGQERGYWGWAEKYVMG